VWAGQTIPFLKKQFSTLPIMTEITGRIGSLIYKTLK